MRGAGDSLPPIATDSSIPARFQQVVQHRAGHLAVVDGAQCVTYAELDAWSAHIAQAVAGAVGDQPQPVALHFGQGLPVIAAMLGVLKAGHFYAVLDTAMPENRVHAVLDNLHSGYLLTDGASKAYHPGMQVMVCPEQPAQPPAAGDRTFPAADALAAIHYTSGATGQPKGVMVAHAMLLHRAGQLNEFKPVSPHDVVAGLFSPAYSSAAADIYGALLNGAILALYRPAQQRVGDLRDWLLASRVTMLHLHSGILRQLLDVLPAGFRFEHLRYVRPSGRTRVDEVRRLRRHLPPDAIVMHQLTSSETTAVTRLVVQGDDEPAGEILPVGYLIDPEQVTLVGADGQPIAGEGEGEVVVRSRYLARGYWRQPELTAQRFHVDPADPRYRSFRMGDRVRRRADGMFELLGRNDQQVKIRGYTVNLEAVEAALARLPGVQETAVIAQSTRHDTVLVAYICMAAADFSSTLLRAALAQELPAYMVPARFIFLDALPRHSNGKVDRQSLPPPGRLRPDLDTPFVAPRSDLEQQIVDLWAELLELDEVGVEDNFFELGGDSILAMRMVLAVEQATGGHIPPEFFQTPTVSVMAGLINGEQATDAGCVSTTEAASLTGNIARDVTRPSKWQSAPGFRLARSLIYQGPTLNGWAMPYAPGIKLQRFLLRIPGFQALLMQKQIARLAAWRHSVTNRAEWRDITEINLSANTWGAWRKHALSTPETQQRWIVAQLAEETARILHSAQPTILVDNHCAVQWARRRVCDAYGSAAVRVGYSGPRDKAELDADYARQMLAAHDALACNHPVLIAGDGFGGWQGVDAPFFGHTRRFRAGAAALAVETGAALIPVFTTLRADGMIVNEFLPPLTREGGSHAAQVESLTRQYAACYMARWPALLASLQWGQLTTLNRELGLTSD